ncbi:dipeptidyl peptidase 4-like isoform X3 [Saccostrea echinata]|uniref:dipeptidyl peptidase 4-like isoform X3 n=1 Tax=Saccostrea echinata TaxID=191078 RepID=UPI002A80CE9B|nr:dipeptidyl peptidase 4-like isoform X3 [Saccostrea echinata]
MTRRSSECSGKYSRVSISDLDTEELVGGTTQQRNWRGIAIALLVILIVCALIITAIILVTPDDDTKKGSEEERHKEKFTFDDFFGNDYKIHSFHPKWRDDDSFVYRNEEGSVLLYNCTSNVTTELLDNSTFRELNTGEYHISADQMFVLLPYEVQGIYRHSKKSKYKILELKTREIRDFNPVGERYQYVSWSPKGHSVVFVHHNSIFYLANPWDQNATPVLIAEDPGTGEIFNGVPDWVYEEEIISSDNAIWWSPSGDKILYAVFNDSVVRPYYYPYYGSMEDAYGTNMKIYYPKPGYANPTFTLKIRMLGTSNQTFILKPPEDFKNKDHYFTTVTWINNDYVLISWLNRAQNKTILTICSAMDGKCKKNQEEESRGGWIDLYTSPRVSPKADWYYMIFPRQESELGSFKQVQMVEASVSNMNKLDPPLAQKKFRTGGTSDVMQIVGLDADSEILYFIGVPNGDSRKRHLYSVSTRITDNSMQATCITCDYNPDCQYVSASFSHSAKYYVLGCLGPSVPFYVLKSTKSSIEITFENNDHLKQKLANKALPVAKYVEIPINDKEYMYAKMLLPPILDTKQHYTYPLLLSVYGGPDSQKVTYKFQLGWEDFLVSSKNYIVAYTDGRGSSGRGQKWLHSIYKSLGTAEIDDTITAGRYLNDISYVESSKKAIWGWSYGGYTTASVIGRGNGLFECGISVAPVTDWHYYDSVYTERYMGMPHDNVLGYKSSNVSQYAGNFKHIKYMLVHGTGDDNVHFQNSAQFIKALVEKDVFFRLQVYTDQQHGLRGGNTRKHLFESLEDFLGECFEGKSKKFEMKQKELEKTQKQEPVK